VLDNLALTTTTTSFNNLLIQLWDRNYNDIVHKESILYAFLVDTRGTAILNGGT